jgi:hypothetical protein
MSMPVRSFVLFSCGFTVPFIEAIHQVDIDENQRNKNINRSLLCEPEAETKTANLNFVEIVHKQDGTTVRDDEPYNQQGTKVLQVLHPIGTIFMVSCHILPRFGFAL